MEGFRQFVEKKDYVSVIKKQLGVPKKLWMGMPIPLSNVKLGKHKIIEPQTFYVKDYDDISVTLVNVEMPDEDQDDEIDLDKTGSIEVTISRHDFEKLLEPQIPAGADTTMMGGL